MKKVLKWLGIILAGLFGLLVISLGVIYLLSSSRMSKTYTATESALVIPSDAASLSEGGRIFVTRGCPDCHDADGAGAVLIDDVMIGTFAGPNLTTGEGGIGAALSTEQLLLAIRHGLGADMKPLLVMPSDEYYPINDREAAALVAYVQNLAPVDRLSIPNKLGPLGRVLLVSNQAKILSAEQIDHTAERPAEVSSGATVEYGKYLVVSCIGCHGAGLSGGAMPGDPSGPPHPSNLTPDAQTGLGSWTEADFITAMRQGVRPDGSAISEKMPWRGFSQMTDEELKALWLYLQTVPPQEFGNR